MDIMGHIFRHGWLSKVIFEKNGRWKKTREEDRNT